MSETLEETLARVPSPEGPEGWCIVAGPSREGVSITLDGIAVATVTLMGAGPAAVARVAVLPSCPPIDEYDLLSAAGFVTMVSLRLSRSNKLFPPGKSTFLAIREILPLPTESVTDATTASDGDCRGGS